MPDITMSRAVLMMAALIAIYAAVTMPVTLVAIVYGTIVMAWAGFAALLAFFEILEEAVAILAVTAAVLAAVGALMLWLLPATGWWLTLQWLSLVVAVVTAVVTSVVSLR